MSRFIQYSFLTSLLWLLPGCAPPQQMRVIIKMMPEQEDHFKTRVIPPFEKENNVKVEVISLESISNLPDAIRRETHNGGINLVKVPFEMTRVLTGQQLILPLDAIVSKEALHALKQEYFLMDLVKIEGHYYYLPRKFETRMLVFLKSKVAEAVQGWTAYREGINETLEKYNGYGLPDNYLLEKDPNEWDFFDIFVAGYYWKSREFEGAKMPRVAHRAKRYSGTSLRMMDRAYQMGATQDDILRLDGRAVVDMLMWEALYTQERIYNPKMYQEEWSGSDIWQGFKDGDVFLSFMTQIDAFFLHGVGTEAMPGYLSNPEDMGVAIMPLGVSMALKKGRPKRVGKRSITTGGWWWGIPRNTPSKDLSFKLAHFILNTENQIEGCSRFGMVPVRQDMLSELGLMFGGGWISNVFHIASQQLVENRFTVIPLIDEYPEIVQNYLEAFYDISIGGNTGPDGTINANYIRKVLQKKYIPVQKKILKANYPFKRRSSGRSPKTRQKFKALNKDLE